MCLYYDDLTKMWHAVVEIFNLIINFGDQNTATVTLKICEVEKDINVALAL